MRGGGGGEGDTSLSSFQSQAGEEGTESQQSLPEVTILYFMPGLASDNRVST